jgi:hypothetical protein
MEIAWLKNTHEYITAWRNQKKIQADVDALSLEIKTKEAEIRALKDRRSNKKEVLEALSIVKEVGGRLVACHYGYITGSKTGWFVRSVDEENGREALLSNDYVQLHDYNVQEWSIYSWPLYEVYAKGDAAQKIAEDWVIDGIKPKGEHKSYRSRPQWISDYEGKEQYFKNLAVKKKDAVSV